jgi:signal transduction histidine kinase
VERSLLEYARGERLIATGRLLLALFALLVIFVDPDIAAGSARLIGVGALFTAYALVAGVLAWRSPMITARARFALHAIDFLLFSGLIELTHASVSPFFTFFLFSLLTALLRFGVRGMLLTGAAAILTYVMLAVTDEMIRSDPGYLIMRVSSLSVATLLLAYVGAYHERVRSELMKLASWPRVASEQRDPLLRETLALARDLLSAPRALLVWEEQEEPWVYAAMADGDSLTITRERPGFLDELLEPDVRRATFLERDSGTYVVSMGGASHRDRPALRAAARERFGIRSVLSAPLGGQMVNGRIFLLDRESPHLDDLSVAQIVGPLIAARLDQLHVTTRMRDAAVADERLRVARDLHDGLLQSLTGAALQLEMTHRLIDNDPAAARERLRKVQDLIAADQRELRSLITQLRPQKNEPRPTLDTRLLELADRFQRQWDVGISINVDPPSPAISEALTAEVYSIIHEAVANAAKHARAGRIDVQLRVGGDVHISVSDDGQGFPFDGTHTLAELNAQRRGPVTLKERVASLGGDLVLESTPHGSRIDVRIPAFADTLSA